MGSNPGYLLKSLLLYSARILGNVENIIKVCKEMIYHHYYSLCTGRQQSRLVGLNREKAETSADLNTEETGTDLETYCPLQFGYSQKAKKIWPIIHFLFDHA